MIVKTELSDANRAYLHEKVFSEQVPEGMTDLVGYMDQLGFWGEKDFIPYIAGKRVLDVGSGGGGLAKYCASLHIPTQIYSVNPRLVIPQVRAYERTLTAIAGAVSEATDNSFLQQAHDRKAVAAYGQELPVLASSFDVVLDNNAIGAYATEDWEFLSAVTEYVRILRPGGKARMGGKALFFESEEDMRWRTNLLENAQVSYRVLRIPYTEISTAIEIVKPNEVI